MLRDRAMEVSGVQSVRVRMGRAKVTVRAQSRTSVNSTTYAPTWTPRWPTAIEELGLARPPALTVHVGRPPAKKG